MSIADASFNMIAIQHIPAGPDTHARAVPQGLRQPVGVTKGTRSDGRNQKFAQDGSYESVQDMLRKLAIKCYGRVEAQGVVGYAFEDVMAIMNESYVMATQKWRPDAGAMFSTYCYRVCLNNFNAAIEKAERERARFGMFPIDDQLHDGDADGEDAWGGDVVQDSASDLALGVQPGPEALAVHGDELRERLNSLSHNSKRLVMSLMHAMHNDEELPKLREIAAKLGLHGQELTAVRREILANFGVRWA